MSYSTTATNAVWFKNGTQRSTTSISGVYGFYAGYDGDKLVARIEFTIEKPTTAIVATWIAQTGTGGTVYLNYAIRNAIDDTLNTADSTVLGDGTVSTGTSSGISYTMTMTGSMMSAGTYYLYLWPAKSANSWIGVRFNSVYKMTITYEGIAGAVRIDNGTSFDTYQVYIDNGSSWDLYLTYIDDGSTWSLYG